MHTKEFRSANGSLTLLNRPFSARRIAGFLAVCLAVGLTLGSQCMTPPASDDSNNDGDNTAPARNQVTIQTNVGKLVIQLYPEQAPQAVAKFLELIDDQAYYDGKIFHDANSRYLVAGAYSVALEDGEDVPFINESNNGMKNIRGRVALYGPTDQESGKPQFLINLTENSNLDFVLGSTQKPPFTVIGRVITGMDIADQIGQFKTVTGTSSEGASLQQIPQTDAGDKVRILMMSSEDTEDLENAAPTADAGADQAVEPNSKVTLDGSKSKDPDGDPIRYEWSISEASATALETAKLEITLDKPTGVSPSFTAPKPSAPIEVVFDLKVTDDRGATSTDSVKITISDNIKPVAKAGDDKTVHPGETVQLDGSGSTDSESQATLTYAWTITPESAQLLTAQGFSAPAAGTSAKYSFTAPAVVAPMPLTFQLTVRDNKGAEATDTVDVQILPVSFNPAVSYIIGDQPSAIATGDFNGDSKPDLAVAKSATNQVAVMLNDGNGAFLTPALYTVGNSPQSIVVADLNNDGSVDIATATVADSKLNVLINNGDGTFAPATTFAMGSGPVSLASGDLDTTTGPDVAAVNTTAASTNSLAVLINDGRGDFPAGNSNIVLTGKDDNSATVTPVGARVMAAGKVDSDNLTDLVVAYADRKVFVLLGDSTKTDNFRFGSYFEAGGGAPDPRGIALADISGDSKLDVAIALNAQNQVSVRKNSGSGRFGFEALYDTGAGPSAVVGADLDGDKDVDLAVANENGNSVSILQNKGTGSFRTKVDLALADTDAGPVGIVAADFNADKAMDLAVVNKASGTVSVLLGLTVAADAGEDQNVLVGQAVTLHGLGKSRQGAAFTYAWAQTAGTPVTLSNASLAEPTFTAPAETTELVFRLTATDDHGATAVDTVIVDVYILTSSGLKYCDVAKGTGAVVQPTSTVSALYTGRLNDRNGDTFDSTAPQNDPRSFSLLGVIEGWTEGLGNYDMRVGGKRLLIIPPELGYGPVERPGIPPNSTLWFEVDVVGLE